MRSVRRKKNTNAAATGRFAARGVEHNVYSRQPQERWRGRTGQAPQVPRCGTQPSEKTSGRRLFQLPEKTPRRASRAGKDTPMQIDRDYRHAEFSYEDGSAWRRWQRGCQALQGDTGTSYALRTPGRDLPLLGAGAQAGRPAGGAPRYSGAPPGVHPRCVAREGAREAGRPLPTQWQGATRRATATPQTRGTRACHSPIRPYGRGHVPRSHVRRCP